MTELVHKFDDFENVNEMMVFRDELYVASNKGVYRLEKGKLVRLQFVEKLDACEIKE